MKKRYHFLTVFILLGFIFSSFVHSSPQKLIIGKWELKEVVPVDTGLHPVLLAINNFFVGITFEYKKDSIVIAELSKKQSQMATIESAPARYYLLKEKKKHFLVLVEHNHETKYEVITLNTETLCYKGSGLTFVLIRQK